MVIVTCRRSKEYSLCLPDHQCDGLTFVTTGQS